MLINVGRKKKKKESLSIIVEYGQKESKMKWKQGEVWVPLRGKMRA